MRKSRWKERGKMKNIINPNNIPIIMNEIYPNIYQFILPTSHYFECCGQSYGNTIYGGLELTNTYIVKEHGTTDEELQL